MITEDKITEIFCMADDFCKLFDAITAKYTLKPTGKRKYHRSSTLSKAEVMLIMILFHRKELLLYDFPLFSMSKTFNISYFNYLFNMSSTNYKCL